MGKGKSLRFYLSVLFVTTGLFATAINLNVDSTATFIDGSKPQFSQLLPGDTLFLEAGTYDHLGFKDIFGTADNPIVIINRGGKVIINGTHYYGLSINNCKYFRFSGAGAGGIEYGIFIQKTSKGAFGIGGLSSDYEIDHIEITSVDGPGILAKTDPDCNFNSTRDKFLCSNIIIHHNYIHNTATEGIYFGSTAYDGVTINCNGTDTLVYAHRNKNVRIHSNLIEYTGWDGIQVASTENFEVLFNTIRYDSQKQENYQMNGIIVGKGSYGAVCNNRISHGAGTGIISFGQGPLLFANNVIEHPGTNTGEPAGNYGIYIDAQYSQLAERSIKVLNNLIIAPKVEAIRHVGDHAVSIKDTIANNLVINELNVQYEDRLFLCLGSEAWKSTNDFVYQLGELALCDSVGSFYTACRPNKYTDAGLFFGELLKYPDFHGNQRMINDSIDMGALEYQGQDDFKEDEKPGKLVVFPNPATNSISIDIIPRTNLILPGTLQVSDALGKIYYNSSFVLDNSFTAIQVPIDELAEGIYIVKVDLNDKVITQKLVKN